MYSDRIGRAVQVAAIRHEHQYRKNPEKRIPYVAHPVAVGMMLMHYGYPEDVVIAGLLHDTVEDTGMTDTEIRKEFGETVAALVAETSEADKSLPWEERKSRYIEHLQTASEEAKAISCCDKIHNMKSMIESVKAGGNIWRSLKRGKEHQIERFTAMLAIFKKSLGKEMVSEYETTLKSLEER